MARNSSKLFTNGFSCENVYKLSIYNAFLLAEMYPVEGMPRVRLYKIFGDRQCTSKAVSLEVNS